MKASTKTWLSVILFVPLAVMLLAMFACLPAPVGDPEKSKVDPALTGIYRLQPTDPTDKSTTLAFLRPWDDKTYYLEYANVASGEANADHHVLHMKAWLTTLGGKTFLTCELLDDTRYALPPDPDDKPVWLVFRLDKVDAGIEARLVDKDSALVKGLTTRAELEKAIAAHAGEQALYTAEPMTFKKLGKDDKAVIELVEKSTGVK